MNTFLKQGVTVLEDLTLSVISKVIEHNVKGYDLLKSPATTVSEINEHNILLINIIALIKPALAIAREFIGKNHPYLLNILNWIEQIYDATIGKAVVA